MHLPHVHVNHVQFSIQMFPTIALELWRWNGSKGPILDAYDDDDTFYREAENFITLKFSSKEGLNTR